MPSTSATARFSLELKRSPKLQSMTADRTDQPTNFSITKQAFCPPKPKLLDSVTLTSASRVLRLGCNPNRTQGSGVSKLIVGCSTWSRMLPMHASASIEPDAPSE